LNNEAGDYRPVSTAEYTGAGSTTCFCGKDGKMLLSTSLLIVSAGAYGKKSMCSEQIYSGLKCIKLFSHQIVEQ